MNKWMTRTTWYQKKEALKKETSMDAFFQEQESISYLTVKFLISWDCSMITERNAARKWFWLRQEEQLWNLKISRIKKCWGNSKTWNKHKNKSWLLLNLPKEHNSWSSHQHGTITWVTTKQQPTCLLKSLRKNIYWRSSNSMKESERNILSRLHLRRNWWRWERRCRSWCIQRDMKRPRNLTFSATSKNKVSVMAKKNKLIKS